MDQGRNRRYKGLDGTALKLIALASMFIDHIGAVILLYVGDYWGELRFLGPLGGHGWSAGLYRLYLGCRIVGRLAFPIFCFLLTEGFIHTHDRRKYCLRMVVFALIAEIPFDLAVSNQVSWSSQNVFFEMAAGLFTLQGLRKAEAYSDPRRSVYMGLSVGGGCILAWFLKADYSYYGIMLMSVYYLLRRKRLPRLLGGSAMAFIESLYITWGAAGLSFIPLYFYNGSRGQRSMKYLFYWFYPVHLLLLFGLRWLVLGIPVKW